MARVYNAYTGEWEEKEMLGDVLPNQIVPQYPEPDPFAQGFWNLMRKIAGYGLETTPAGQKLQKKKEQEAREQEAKASEPLEGMAVEPWGPWTEQVPEPEKVKKGREKAKATYAKGKAKKKVVAGETRPQYTASPAQPSAAPQIVPPPFAALQFTPRTDVTGEFESMLGALPSKLSDLAGARPTVQRPKGLMNNLIATMLLSLQPGGKEGYFQTEEEKLLKPWKEEVEFQKERQKTIQDLKLRAFDARLKQNAEVREEEMKAYARLGERNPLLGYSPEYEAGFYRDLPKSYVDKLMADSKDPTTGAFKPGATLYLPLEKRWELKKQEASAVLKGLGITDEKQIAEFVADPQKWWERYNASLESFEKRLMYLQTQPQTPANQAEYARIKATMLQMKEKAGQIPSYVEAAKTLEMYEKLRKRDLLEAKKQAEAEGWTKEQLQARVNQINDQFAEYKHTFMVYTAGKGYAVAGMRSKSKLTDLPIDYQMEAKYITELDPTIGKGDTADTAVNVRLALERGMNHPKNVNIIQWANSKEGLSPMARPYFIKIYRGIRGDLAGKGYSDLLEEAGSLYGGKEKIPFYNIYQAGLVLFKDPKNKAAIRAALLSVRGE